MNAVPDAAATAEGQFDFRSGNLCLDFLNTCGTHDPIGDEHLRSYEDMVEWCEQAGILEAAEAAERRRFATDQPAEALVEFGRAVALREVLYHVFISFVRQGDVLPGDMETLTEALGNALANMRLERVDGGVGRTWAGRPQAAWSLLWPMVVSAGELLTTDDLGRVAQCGGEGCDWLFVVANRGRARRWCSMSACGNRAKAKRHYQRAMAAKGSANTP